jgi:hypothetical protein
MGKVTERFADRVAPETYQGDESWVVGLVRAGRAVDWASTLPDEHTGIPEGIAERLLALGRAYRLHQLSALDVSVVPKTREEFERALADRKALATPSRAELARPLGSGPASTACGSTGGEIPYESRRPGIGEGALIAAVAKSGEGPRRAGRRHAQASAEVLCSPRLPTSWGGRCW